MRSGDQNQVIHCIWYCINVASSRFEPEEIKWLREFTEQNDYNVPVIVVLTQAFSKKLAQDMKEVIEAENLQVMKVLPVLAQDYEIDDEFCRKAYGLDTLIEVMQEVLPDKLIDTLMHVQQVNLSKKGKVTGSSCSGGCERRSCWCVANSIFRCCNIDSD